MTLILEISSTFRDLFEQRFFLTILFIIANKPSTINKTKKANQETSFKYPFHLEGETQKMISF